MSDSRKSVMGDSTFRKRAKSGKTAPDITAARFRYRRCKREHDDAGVRLRMVSPPDLEKKLYEAKHNQLSGDCFIITDTQPNFSAMSGGPPRKWYLEQISTIRQSYFLSRSSQCDAPVDHQVIKPGASSVRVPAGLVTFLPTRSNHRRTSGGDQASGHGTSQSSQCVTYQVSLQVALDVALAARPPAGAEPPGRSAAAAEQQAPARGPGRPLPERFAETD